MLKYIGEVLILSAIQGLLRDNINIAASSSTVLADNKSFLSDSANQNENTEPNLMFQPKNLLDLNKIQLFLQDSGPEVSATSFPPSTNSTNITTPFPHVPTVPVSHDKRVRNILLYVLLPISLVAAGVAVILLVYYIRKYRRKRRLQRELLPEYSFYSSDVDLTEALVDDTENLNPECFTYHNSTKTLETDLAELPRLTISIPQSPKLVVQTEPYSSPSDDDGTSLMS